jgi:tetratricopeptide (TPR) repeat protein
MIVRHTVALLVLAALAAPVGAQNKDAKDKCNIDEANPGQVRDARNALVKGGLVSKPEEKMKQLSQAVKLLTDNPAKINNVNGRNWVLGRALITIATQPNMAPVVQRSMVGYSANPTGTVDLLAAADSAFDLVEAAIPECRTDTEEYRRVAYAPLVNAAVNLYNSQQVDSAVLVAQRATMIYPDYPLSYIAYNVIGNAAQAKSDYKTAIENFSKLVDAIGSDTAYQDEKRTTRLTIGALATEMADKAEGAEKQPYVKTAVDQYEAFLRENPGDCNALSGLARTQLSAGDTSSANKSYQEILTNAGKCTDFQLFEAGVSAARADRNKEAIEFFDAGLKKNPYSRDGLYGLAATLSQVEQWDRVPDLATRLIAVDPENPDNYRLWAIYYQARAKPAKEAAAKKPATDPASKTFQAINDSLLKYYNRFSEAPVKVSFSLFNHNGAKHTLGGTIENKTAESKSYTLKFEFLDASGKVVATKETTLASVDGKASKSFRIEVDGEGIVAFRYAPLT